MKTITEFGSSTIRAAAEAHKKPVGEGVAAEAMSERLGTERGGSGDRVARLVEALEAVGDRIERVRLVRVFASPDEPKGAKKVGEFHYLVDLQPDARPGRGDARGDKRR